MPSTHAPSARLTADSQRAPVAVTLNVTDASAIRLTKYGVTITPANWTTTVTVNVSAVDGSTSGGQKTAAVVFSTASADAAFSSVAIPELQYTVVDNTTVGLLRGCAAMSGVAGGSMVPSSSGEGAPCMHLAPVSPHR